MEAWFLELKDTFILNFVEDQRWMYLVKGLWVTLSVTFFALMIGVVIGVLCATIRSAYDQNKETMEKSFLSRLFSFLNGLVEVYITITRGTPVVLQLLIGYFIIFVSSTNMVLVASLVFGINSGAYITEIIRSGIMSIDAGQMEAGRSLGMGYIGTMKYIIIPQAFKVVLPTLANEFIALLKETAVCGYIGLMDLTKAGDIIRGRTFTAFMPLIAVALIYLILVLCFSWLTGLLEKKLRTSSC